MPKIIATADGDLKRSRFLYRAESAEKESKHLDFKRDFPDSAMQWAEVIKDIVALANSGGGVIIFGVNDDGTTAACDTSKISKLDPADITNKIDSYTNYQFAEVEIVEIKRKGDLRTAFMVGSAGIPIVFTRPGADVVVKGKQRPAFARGTIYFRHGAKSEPATRDDLSSWADRMIETARNNWVKGIRKVVEAPPGHKITVVSTPPNKGGVASRFDGMAISAEISAAPGSVRVVPQNAEELWPYRQKDLLYEINKKIRPPSPVNGHDILCINSHLEVLKKHPEFAYKPHRLASPQYSDHYVTWIVEQYRQDPKFFKRLREEYKAR